MPSCLQDIDPVMKLKARWKEQKLVEGYIQRAEQAFAVSSPPCPSHYLRRNKILAIIYITFENDLALTVGPSSTASRLLWQMNIDAIMDTSVDFSP